MYKISYYNVSGLFISTCLINVLDILWWDQDPKIAHSFQLAFIPCVNQKSAVTSEHVRGYPRTGSHGCVGHGGDWPVLSLVSEIPGVWLARWMAIGWCLPIRCILSMLQCIVGHVTGGNSCHSPLHSTNGRHMCCAMGLWKSLIFPWPKYTVEVPGEWRQRHGWLVPCVQCTLHGHLPRCEIWTSKDMKSSWGLGVKLFCFLRIVFAKDGEYVTRVSSK